MKHSIYIYIYIYIYNRTLEWYIKKNEKSIPSIYALAVISLVQILNLTTIILIGAFMFSIKWEIEKYYVFLFYFVLVLANFLVLKTEYSVKMANKWKLEEISNKKLRKSRGYLVVFYLLLSLTVCLYCAVKFSPKKW